MNPWAKATLQGTACRLMLGMVLLMGGRLWQPQVAAAQPKQPAVPDVLRAGRFEVVDAAGKVRASLGLGTDGTPLLAVYDAAGKARAGMIMLPDGSPALFLYDAAGKARAGVMVLPDGSPALGLRDAAGKRRAVMMVDRDGSPALDLRDAEEKVIWKAP